MMGRILSFTNCWDDGVCSCFYIQVYLIAGQIV